MCVKIGETCCTWRQTVVMDYDNEFFGSLRYLSR
jgi:hypothetical protein